MGLIDSTNDIGKNIGILNNIQQTRETEKEINARLERKLECEFMEGFRGNGLIYKYTCYDIDFRENVIRKLGNNQVEFNKLSNLYDKVLNRVIRIFKKHTEAMDWFCNEKG